VALSPAANFSVKQNVLIVNRVTSRVDLKHGFHLGHFVEQVLCIPRIGSAAVLALDQDPLPGNFSFTITQPAGQRLSSLCNRPESFCFPIQQIAVQISLHAARRETVEATLDIILNDKFDVAAHG
jgi:hypothetical protein